MQPTLENTPAEVVKISQAVKEIRTLLSNFIEERHKHLSDRLISPAETCELFYPKISKATLNRWEKKGFIKKYTIGGRTYFKYSEIMDSLTTLQRYKR